MKMNPDQKRHLATILRMIEKNLSQKEQLLRSGGEKGILYEIVDPLREEQRQALLAHIAMLRDGIAQIKERFGLAVERSNLQRMIAGEFNILWVWLQETKAKKLKRYGVVGPELEQELDPLLTGMAELVDAVLKTLVLCQSDFEGFQSVMPAQAGIQEFQAESVG
jgi:hypothetical protein